MTIVVTPVCFLLGFVALVFAVGGLRKRNRILSDWIQLNNAVVLESNVEVSNPWAYAVVRYEYHSGDRYFVGESSPSVNWNGWLRGAERVAEQYCPGDVISIYVNPDNHQESVIQPLPSAGLCMVGMAFSLVSILVGIILGIYRPIV